MIITGCHGKRRQINCEPVIAIHVYMFGCNNWWMRPCLRICRQFMNGCIINASRCTIFFTRDSSNKMTYVQWHFFFYLFILCIFLLFVIFFHFCSRRDLYIRNIHDEHAHAHTCTHNLVYDSHSPVTLTHPMHINGNKRFIRVVYFSKLYSHSTRITELGS